MLIVEDAATELRVLAEEVKVALAYLADLETKVDALLAEREEEKD